MKDRAERIERELAALAADVARRRFGVRDWAGGVTFQLELEPDASGEWRLAGHDVLETLHQALREAAALTSPFQLGRVFCHRCETSGCAHSVPSSPTQVFGAYGQTGLPEWADLGRVLLADRHPDVDQLYGGGRLLTHVLAGRDLKQRQLPAFGRGSKTYDVLGQVVAGYFFLGGRPREGAEKVALTFQAVEHRGPKKELRLDLNVVGRTASGEDAVPVLSESLGERLADPVRSARAALNELQHQLRGPTRRDRKARSKILGQVPSVMRKLSRDLTVGPRRARRRTAHAEVRRAQSRPVQAAVREGLGGRPERTYVDEREGTMVVLGRRNRAHVFSPDGRLVTSLTLEQSAVDRRVRIERWRRASDEEFLRFKERLKQRSSAG